MAGTHDDPPPSPSRRRALRIGTGGALALVLGAGAGWLDRRHPETVGADAAATVTTTTSTTTTTTVPFVIDGLGEVEPGIVALGRRVVERLGWDDATALATTLAVTPTDDPVLAATDRVAAEFRAGDTVSVDGWVLAASEARAAALLALACGDAC